MDSKVIVLKANGEVAVEDYKSFADIRRIVSAKSEEGNGLAELCISQMPMPNPMSKTRNMLVDVFCNEEGLLIDSEDMNKVNPLATYLYSGTLSVSEMSPIYGDVALLINEGESDRGFEYFEEDNDGVAEEAFCEAWFAEDTLLRAITRLEDILQEIDETFTNNKPEPKYEFVSFEEYFGK